MENRSLDIKRLSETFTVNINSAIDFTLEQNVHCAGMNHPVIPSHSKANFQSCLRRWDYSKGAWRAKKCLHRTHIDVESAVIMGWNTCSDSSLQCPTCFFAKGSVARNSAKLVKGNEASKSVRGMESW